MVRQVSVIIPCFNAASTLADAIQSALSQSRVELEVVVVDDGSCDCSVAVARGFGPTVRVLTGPNQGASVARNRGISAAGGQWIIFLDADDLLVPNTVVTRLDTAERTDADVIVCDWQEFIDHHVGAAAKPIQCADMALLIRDAEIACATHFKPAINALMYRRSVVQKAGCFRPDLPIIQDARLLFDVAQQGARFAHSPHLGARVRISPQSLSRGDPARFWGDCLLNGMQIEAIWRTRGSLSAEQSAALADIYNCAAHGLFRAGDPTFREVLAALRASGLPISRRNRLAELLSNVAGHRTAMQMAQCWTTSRRKATGMFRRSPILRSALPGSPS